MKKTLVFSILFILASAVACTETIIEEQLIN